MSDVFIGYERADRERASVLARVLRRKGLSIWWDRDLPVSTNWSETIETELSAARAVVILWTRASAESAWVREEAYYAQKENKLVPVALEGVRPPLGLHKAATFDLSTWKGSEIDPALEPLLVAIRSLVATSPSRDPRRNQASVVPSRQRDDRASVGDVARGGYDVFLSYAREDRSAASSLAKALQDEGRSVWWDRRIPAGKRFYEVIEHSLNSSRVVAVLWSHHSAASVEVKDEAYEGKLRGILVPALIAQIDVPFGFKLIQAADLSDWDSQPNHPGFIDFLEAIANIVDGPPSVTA